MNRATGLILLVLTLAGCAQHQPRPLTILAPLDRLHRPVVAEERIELKLVTFNVWGLPTWINGASPERFPRIARELETLNPDFAVLQEAWTRRAQSSAPRGTNWWIAQAACSDSFFRRSGLVTVARHPIVGGEFHPFHIARWPDAIVSKGALKTTIELAPGVRVNLWNVHLQAGESPRADRIRCHQINELAAWVGAANDGQIADLVSGDFNCEPGSPTYQQLQKHIGIGALELGHSQPISTYDGMNPSGREHRALDHVLIRLRHPMLTAQAHPEVAFTSEHPVGRLSDHYGITVKVRLTSGLYQANPWPPESLASHRAQPGMPARDLATPLASYPSSSTAQNGLLLR